MYELQKYAVDEGPDPELMDDSNGSDDSDADSSCSEMSDNETEDNDVDIEEMGKELRPYVDCRINAWPEKGIHFQLKTVHPSVTVAEWLAANQESTTTTRKSTKTVINELNKTTTITTTRTKTTTSRTSFATIHRGTVAGESTEEERSTGISDKDSIDQANEALRSKKFNAPKNSPKPSRLSKTATVQNINLQRRVPSPSKIQRLSPPTMKLRNGKKPAAVHAKPIASTKTHSRREVTPNNDSVKNVKASCDEVTDVDQVGNSHSTLEVQDHRSHEPNAISKATDEAVIDPRAPWRQSQAIVIYSPSAGKKFGTKLSDQLLSVTNNDLKKLIDPKYHRCTSNLSSIEKCVVPVNQRIVFEPPMEFMSRNDTNDDDSEIDDDLLTSYKTSARVYRLNFK